MQLTLEQHRFELCWSTYSGTEGFTGEVYIDNTYVGAKK